MTGAAEGTRRLILITVLGVAAAVWSGAAPAAPLLPPPITGNLYVSSYGTGEVYCYSPDGRFRFSFGHEDLKGTRGLAFGRSEEDSGEGEHGPELYVSAEITDRVLVFDPEGNYRRQFSGGGLDGPTSLAFGPQGKLYVSSFETHEILVFAGDEYESKFAADGLRGPNCIAFSASGQIFVASQLTNRIYQFAADGTFIRHFEDRGLRSPMGIAIYGTEIFITGGASHTVSVFDLDGTLVRHVDTSDSISGPQGIAFDDQGDFAISSFYSGKVALYARSSSTPEFYFEESGVKVARSLAYLPISGGPQSPFVRGDFNRDGRFDISDPVAELGYLFGGVRVARCFDAGDTNDDGRLDITDAIYSLGHLFSGGPPPPEPFPQSGLDPTDDDLECH